MKTELVLTPMTSLATAVHNFMAASTETAQRETASLRGALDSSSCRFQRNCSWHDAVEARAHL